MEKPARGGRRRKLFSGWVEFYPINSLRPYYRVRYVEYVDGIRVKRFGGMRRTFDEASILLDEVRKRMCHALL